MEKEIIIDLENIDVENIISQIHTNIANRGYSEADITSLNTCFAISNISTISATPSECIDTMAGKAGVQYWWPMSPGIGVKGKLKTFAYKVIRKLSYFYMKHVIEQQIEFNRSAVHTVTTINNVVAASNEKYEAQIALMLDSIEQLKIQVRLLMESLELQKFNFEELTKEISQLRDIEVNNHNNLNIESKKIQDLYQVVLMRMSRFQTLAEQDQEKKAEIIPVLKVPLGHFDYYAFENKYRGSREDVKNKQQVYLPYFLNRNNIVDFGCGRGEFLEILKENGIVARGFDLNVDNVNECNQRGLEATAGDAMTYLESCENDSLGGIIALQVAEHMTTASLMALLRLGYQKLSPGSPIIIETLNAQCLMIYVESMYLDPSHTKPIHPYTLQFMADSVGYRECELKFLSPSNPSLRIPTVGYDSQKSASIEVINNLIFGDREYALISYK